MKSYATATTIVVLSIFKFYEWYMNDTQRVILVRIEEPLDLIHLNGGSGLVGYSKCNQLGSLSQNLLH